MITPTYARLNQKADLTRLSYTLILVPRLHWIIVEDSEEPTSLVTNFLSRLQQEVIPDFCSDLKVTRLNVATPDEFKLRARDPNWLKPRGVLQRNLGLQWIRSQYRKHRQTRSVVNDEKAGHESKVRQTRAASTQETRTRSKQFQEYNWNPDVEEKDVRRERRKVVDDGQEEKKEDGKSKLKDNGNDDDSQHDVYDYFSASSVVYFADDDNTYDIRLFEEMRWTKKVSVWPVAFVGGLKVEKPFVSDTDSSDHEKEKGHLKQQTREKKKEHVIGFNAVWKPDRPYPIDMAGFAVSLRLIIEKEDAVFTYQVPRGYQESHLLSQVIESREDLEPKASSCTQVLVWHTRTEKPKVGGERRLEYPSDQHMEF